MENKKQLKKKWNRPVINSTLSIKKTLGVQGSMGRDMAGMVTLFTS